MPRKCWNACDAPSISIGPVPVSDMVRVPPYPHEGCALAALFDRIRRFAFPPSERMGRTPAAFLSGAMMKRSLLLFLIPLLLLGLPAAGLAQLNNDHIELEGVIDIHAHVGPATELSISRSLDAIEAAQLAQRHGMRAIVFK